MRSQAKSEQNPLEQLVEDREDLIQKAAKLGWLAKGSLYMVLGTLALLAAVGSGRGQVTGTTGLLHWVADQTFGQGLLVAAGSGFLGYSFWRFTQATLDPQRHGSDVSKWAKRIGWAASGVIHVALAVASFQLLNGSRDGGKRKMWLDEVLAVDGGAYLVGLVRFVVIGVGLYQFEKSVALGFMDQVDRGRMSSTEVKTLKLVGRLGYAARGFVFAIIGYFLLQAAVDADASAAKGVGGSLGALAEAGWGWLAVVALGLAAYGALNLLYARYRSVEI